jgi:large subunit ribosomal protein L3
MFIKLYEPITRRKLKMKKFIIGRKIGMTQLFKEDGEVIPVTVVEAGQCTVVRKKDIENDGYSALVIGYEDIKEKRLNKPEKGLFQKMDVAMKKYLKEFIVEDVEKYEIGNEIKLEDMFKDGEKVDVTGISKGKGFQGVIKRYGQSRGRETHGSHYHRGVGSMGGCSSPAKVFKGKKLPGHMGVDKVTVQNLNVVKVIADKSIMLIKGAIPGPKGGLLTIKETVKQ